MGNPLPPQQVHACPRTDWARLGWGLVRPVRCRTRGKCSHRPDGSCCRLGDDALRGHRLLSRDRSASCASGSPNAATSAAQTWSRADAVELLSAAGTFLTAVAAVVSVSGIILVETARASTALVVSLGWSIGATMQIAAGIIARMRAEASATS